jgi:hypothetical protein
MITRMVKLFILFLMSITIYACTNLDSGPIPDPSPSFDAIPSPIFTPTDMVGSYQPSLKTSIPTLAPTFPVARTSIPSLTPGPDESLIPVCSASGAVVPYRHNMEIPGVILYQKGKYQRNGLFMLGGTSERPVLLSDDAEQRIVFHGISPDSQWAAFSPVVYGEEDMRFVAPTMILISRQGERLEIPFDDSRYYGDIGTNFLYGFSGKSYWINQKLLYLELIAIPLPESGNKWWTSFPSVFNPFEKDWEDGWMNTLPGRSKIRPNPFYGLEIGIAPDMSRVLYPAEEGGIILFDLQTNTIIWKEKEFVNINGNTIRWSPAGDTVAVANTFSSGLQDRAFLLISSDGKRVTKLVDRDDPANLVHFISMAWSRDGQFLAFIYTSQVDLMNHEIFIYDTVNGQYLSRCPVYMDLRGNLFWSPDNQWIGIQGFDGPLRVMNVVTGEVVELGDEGRIVGWTDQFFVDTSK